MKKKVVLAYSGGLDTSVIIQWLVEKYDMEVIAFAANVGQAEELTGLREKALNTGASKVYIEDLRDIFVREYVFPVIKAAAVYEGCYLMGTSIARPLIAKRQIEIARQEGAGAVAHGSTGKGNDQVRFELAYLALQPDIQIIAPWREWAFTSRKELIEYAQKHRIPISVSLEKPYSTDRNLFHISFEGGILEDPWAEPPDSMFLLTVSPQAAPDKPTYIEIDFQQGIPVSLNGKTLPPVELLTELNTLGGANGIGRVDIVENRFVGIKSRGVYETPGGTILHTAHRAVESITLDREVLHMRDEMIPRYARLVYNGFWFSPELATLRALTDEIQKNVTGRVRMKLYKGNCIVVGRQSPVSLYQPKVASFEESGGYNQADATGFIRINAVRLKAQRQR